MATTLVHEDQTPARNLVVRGGHVYFGQPTSDVDDLGRIVRVPVTGGSPTTVVASAERFFAASDTQLFYQVEGELLARPLDGGDAEVIAAGDHVLTDLEGMLYADGAVYRAHEGFINGPDPDALSRTDVASGDVEDLAVDEAVASAFFGMPAWTVGADVLAWGRSDGGAASAPLGGGAPTTLPGTAGREVTAIAADGDAVVLIASEAFGGQLVRIADGTAEVLFDDVDDEYDLDFPYAMHVTPSWIWVGVDDALLRFPRTGGAPVVVPAGSTVMWITSDGSDVYWVENSLGTPSMQIRRLAE